MHTCSCRYIPVKMLTTEILLLQTRCYFLQVGTPNSVGSEAGGNVKSNTVMWRSRARRVPLVSTTRTTLCHSPALVALLAVTETINGCAVLGFTSNKPPSAVSHLEVGSSTKGHDGAPGAPGKGPLREQPGAFPALTVSFVTQLPSRARNGAVAEQERLPSARVWIGQGPFGTNPIG